MPPCWIVRSSRVTPVTPLVTPTTGGPLIVPSRTAREPSGPPGHLVMVTGDLIVTSWSSIVPETLMVAPEAALVRAWLTVARGLADVHAGRYRLPCDTYKVFGAAAWAATGRCPKGQRHPPTGRRRGTPDEFTHRYPHIRPRRTLLARVDSIRAMPQQHARESVARNPGSPPPFARRSWHGPRLTSTRGRTSLPPLCRLRLGAPGESRTVIRQPVTNRRPNPGKGPPSPVLTVPWPAPAAQASSCPFPQRKQGPPHRGGKS